MTLKTKSIYEPKEDRDGVRVLIARYYPRGVKKDRFDRWVKELSPSKELLHAYRSGRKSWAVFGMEFRKEVRANPAGLEAIRTLRKESVAGNVTLLCYEKEGENCHRCIVAEMVGKSRLRGRS